MFGLSKLLWEKLVCFPALVCWHSQQLEGQGRRSGEKKNGGTLIDEHC